MTPCFVHAEGTQFSLNGARFPVVGANNYYLGFAADSLVRPVFELAGNMGLNTLRTWAFLDCGAASPGNLPGISPAGAKDGVYFQYWNSAAGKPDFNDGPNGLERLDRTIFLAEQAGIRLILPLVNYWDDFGGVNQYLEWFGLSGRHHFYSNPGVKHAYRNYVEHLLLRVNTRTGRQYRNEPAILAWELMNEPRCVNRRGGRLRGGVDTLHAWVTEMSGFLRSLDPNHLIGIGDEGYFRRRLSLRGKLYNGFFGVDWQRLLEIPTVAFGTCHLYPDMARQGAPGKFGARWIREHIQAGNRANKPVLIEEYGMKSGGRFSRAEVFARWQEQVASSSGAGALLWMIASTDSEGQPYPDYDGYTVYEPGHVPVVR